MQGVWFRPKRYGYGAEPSGWKGWLAVAGFVGLVLALSALIHAALRNGDLSAPVAVVVWIACLAAAAWLFARFCRARTEGEWRWRWGGR
jgi:hypothetical protein